VPNEQASVHNKTTSSVTSSQRKGKLSGIAINIGARIAAAASPGEVLVSSTVRDLVAGSGLTLEDRGRRELKGASDTWQLYAATKDATRLSSGS
jgi:class 3 adenylate cyclase